jgi:ribosomal-protein-alanine N-acetyltransferase
MTHGVRVAIQYAFGPLNFHRVEANYHPQNERSARLLKRLGFIEEGIAQNYLYINKAWQPHMRTSLTNANWQPVQPSSHFA